MSRKDYVAIADAIAAEMQTGDAVVGAGLFRVACVLCQAFEQDNPRFDADRFLLACGFVEGERLFGGRL